MFIYAELAAFGTELETKGFAVFTTETHDEDSHFCSRFFSPYFDIFEDPVTDSANGPMAVYLVKNNVYELDDAAKLILKAE